MNSAPNPSTPSAASGSGEALLTDLYQLAMAEVYYRQGIVAPAVFELFVRRLPRDRNFLMAAGLEQALDFLETVRFTPEELDWLAGCGHFSPAFVETLASFEFTGDVYAMPEGTAFFGDEPVLQVVAPLPQAQIVESRLINLVHAQSMMASKAARMKLAARGRPLLDFGFRRSHGAEAGLMAARASYVAGFQGTATVAAGQRFGIPLFGTMAHSYVQAQPSELHAFLDFARIRPTGVTLLIDTYDIDGGARAAARAASILADEGIRIGAVRIDSGGLDDAARRVRAILDDAGHPEIRIVLSGSLDEYRVDELDRSGCPVDGFGIGTRLAVSEDAPSLDIVFKLQEYDGEPRRKRSESKETLPGRKQVFRTYAESGEFALDLIGEADEALEGERLLRPVMSGGARTEAPESLDVIRARAEATLKRLPEALRALAPAPAYPVEIAASLHTAARRADAAIL